jgi:hypothetical protein
MSVAINAGWKMSVVVVFGGTGFLGRRLVHRLAAEGTRVRVAVRHPNRGRSALRAADLDQITFFHAVYATKPQSLPPLKGPMPLSMPSRPMSRRVT